MAELPKDVIAFLLKESPRVPILEPDDITAGRAAETWGVSRKRALDKLRQMERDGKGTMIYKVNMEGVTRNRELVFVPKK